MADIILPTWSEELYFSLTPETRGLLIHGDMSLKLFDEALPKSFYEERDAFLALYPPNCRDLEYFRQIEESESMVCTLSMSEPALVLLLSESLGRSFTESVTINVRSSPIIVGLAPALRGWTYLFDSFRSVEEHILILKETVIETSVGWSLRDLSVVYLPLSIANPSVDADPFVVLPSSELVTNAEGFDLCIYTPKDRSYRIWTPECSCVRRNGKSLRINLCHEHIRMVDSFFVLSCSTRVSSVFVYSDCSLGAAVRAFKRIPNETFAPASFVGGELGVADLYLAPSAEFLGVPYQSPFSEGDGRKYARSWVIRDVTMISRLDFPCVYGVYPGDKIFSGEELVTGSFFWAVTPNRVIGVMLIPSRTGKLRVLSRGRVRILDCPMGGAYFHRDCHRIHVYSPTLTPSVILDMAGEAYVSCAPDDATSCVGLPLDAASWMNQNADVHQEWIRHGTVAYLDVPLDVHESYYFSGGVISRSGKVLGSPWFLKYDDIPETTDRGRLYNLLCSSPGLTRREISIRLSMSMTLVATLVAVPPFISIFVGDSVPGSDVSLQRRFYVSRSLPVRSPLAAIPTG